MEIIKPPRLKCGDLIGVVAPASSASLIKKGNLKLAKKNLESLGFKVQYGKNIFRFSELSTDSIKPRLTDFHHMFKSKSIKAVMAVIGGYTSNQLLPFIDFKLIKNNPKIFIGFSDVTALQNAIFTKTGLITFSGPCFATMAQTEPPFNFELKYFKKVLMDGESDIIVEPSKTWAEDEWWQTPRKHRQLMKNGGWRFIKAGSAEGEIIGGNLSTFLLLLKTPYCPSFKNKILFIEEDPCMNKGMIERMLTQLVQLSDFRKLRGLVIGRFGSRSGLASKEEGELLKILVSNFDIPVVSNLDFGHTSPMITFPIGGRCEINTQRSLIKFKGSSVQ
ncbi:MAG: S66 peptidase family protein [Candidatus Jorgensenbacteria bacterium]